MGGLLGAGLHDFILTLFHAWTYIATALLSALAAGVTAWHSAIGKGFRLGRKYEQDKRERDIFESHVRRGYYDLDTPRPRDMPPLPPRRRNRDHYHD